MSLEISDYLTSKLCEGFVWYPGVNYYWINFYRAIFKKQDLHLSIVNKPSSFKDQLYNINVCVRVCEHMCVRVCVHVCVCVCAHTYMPVRLTVQIV